jgi:hypothetical protein
MTLSAIGLALTPAGGSVCMRLKSRISLLRAAVDILLFWCSLQNRIRFSISTLLDSPMQM